MTKQANRNPIKEQEEEQDKKFNGKKALKKVIFFKYFFFPFFRFRRKKLQQQESGKREGERDSNSDYTIERGEECTQARRARNSNTTFSGRLVSTFSILFTFSWEVRGREAGSKGVIT